MSKAKKPAAKKKPAKAKVYLVVRDGFDAYDYDGISYERPTDDEGDRSLVPVRAFADKKAATEYARQLDEEVRATFPPSLFVGSDDDDAPPPGKALVAKVKELGLPKFKPGKFEYETGKLFRKWWAANVKGMSAEQRAALWEPLAGLSFHHVKTIDLEG